MLPSAMGYILWDEQKFWEWIYVQGGEAPKVPSAEYSSTRVLWDIFFRRNSGNGKYDVFKGVRRPKCQVLAKVKPSSACPTNCNNRSLRCKLHVVAANMVGSPYCCISTIILLTIETVILLTIILVTIILLTIIL